MTGVPTQFAIADLVLAALRNAGEPVPDEADLPFFYLGAVGPAFGDFLPTRVEIGAAGSNSTLFDVWLPLFRLLAGTPGTPGMAANLRTLKDTLRRFGAAVRDEDKFALLDMKSDLTALPGLIATLRTRFGLINGIRTGLPDAIKAVRPLDKTPPAVDWHPRDTLHGHLTGKFWGELRRRGADSPDPRLKAFGLGAVVGYAGALCGNPFVNGAVGAPYRNHWWRHRWISHHVDAWVWGYYGTRERVRARGEEIVFSNSERVPIPPYKAWDNIPGSELQNRFAIGGITPDTVLNSIRDGVAVPAHLPADLVTLWLDCYRDTVGDPPSPGVDPAGLQGAYAVLWLTTWINCSGELLGATPPHRINDPDGCGDRPDWVEVDGSVVSGGTVTPPPTINPPSPSAAEIASGIAAAILGVAAFLFGAAAAGIALIAAAVALVDDATDPDWQELHCHLGWVNSFLAQLENAFRDLLGAGGLGPPYADRLAHNEIQFQTWGGQIIPPDAALSTCRSPSALEGGEYPASTWVTGPGPVSNWPRYPAEPPEPPRQISYPEGSWYPRHFVDGFSFVDNGPTAVPRFPGTQDNPLDAPLGKPSVLDPDQWELRMQRAEHGGIPQGVFGNAVDVSLTLIRAPQSDLLNWDLDGDRGIGWPTWTMTDPTNPGHVVRE
ncbi:hypothetical protein [Rhizohabitans arisaemae]|uniref:hypothetical protein n=1 Tax=Rhizohabitans arisaemae TaxID=2720610 RepID=UPI0024B0F360|nr:hypothetical protein [Rhizohabitans arisaemae]